MAKGKGETINATVFQRFLERLPMKLLLQVRKLLEAEFERRK